MGRRVVDGEVAGEASGTGRGEDRAVSRRFSEGGNTGCISEGEIAGESSGTGRGKERAVSRRFSEGVMLEVSLGWGPLGGDVNEGVIAGSISEGDGRVTCVLAECCPIGALVPGSDGAAEVAGIAGLFRDGGVVRSNLGTCLGASALSQSPNCPSVSLPSTASPFRVEQLRSE